MSAPGRSDAQLYMPSYGPQENIPQFNVTKNLAGRISAQSFNFAMASPSAPVADNEKIGDETNIVVNDENIKKPTSTVITDEEEEVILRKIDLQ